MDKIIIASRIVLMSMTIFGTYSLCELLKPQFENQTQYIITFVVILLICMISLVDWSVKTKK